MENREKVPVRYRKNAQTAALLDTLGLPAQQMADLVEDVKKQFFIETATWSLPLWEYQVGITPPANATETSRRNAIKAHLLAGGNTNAANMTWAKLENMNMTWERLEESVPIVGMKQ